MNMFARRVADYTFGGRGRMAKKPSAHKMTGVLKENNGRNGAGSKIPVARACQSLQQFFKKPSRPPIDQLPVEDVLPDVIEDVDMREECVETFDAFYAQDIHTYLKSVEAKCSPGKTFLDGDISAGNRRTLVAWMIEVQEYLQMHHETFHLAVTIADLVLASGTVKLGEYQLLGVVAVFIAAKYIERYVPEIDTLMYLCSYAYDYRTIVNKEKDVLDILDYDLNLPTPSWFLDYYQRDEESRDIQRTVPLFLGLFALDEESVLRFPPSMRAASSLMIANRFFASPNAFWQRDLVVRSGYSSASLESANGKLKAMIDGLGKKRRFSLEQTIVDALSGNLDKI